MTKVARPSSARRLGEARLTSWLKARGVRKAENLSRSVIWAARGQKRELPAAEAKATLAAQIAADVSRLKERIATLDTGLQELVASDSKGALVRTLPGMGVVLTAEFLAEAGNLERFESADRLAAAAGIAPVLRASGSVAYQRRARQGNRGLKQVFYRSAFCALSYQETSKAFYRRKRAEGKRHHQAVLALARRRVNVLWAAMLREGRSYEEPSPHAA